LNSELSLISLLGFEMLFDCFISRFYMRVLKLTLGKNNFCKFFPQFFSVKRPDGLFLRPNDSVTRPKARSSDSPMVRLHIRMLVTCPHVYEATRVRTGLMIRPDEDPTASIKHGRHIFSLPHKISPLACSERFLTSFCIISLSFVFLCKSLTFLVFF